MSTTNKTPSTPKKRKIKEVDYDKEESSSSEEAEKDEEGELDDEDDAGEGEGDAEGEGGEEGDEEGEDEEDDEGKKKDADDADDEDQEEKDLDTSVYEDGGGKADDTVKAMLNQFNADQTARYEYYRRATFQRSNIKKIMQNVAGCPINQTMSIVMGGITKVFVGEVVETARTIMDEWKETGPIRPKHLREAYRRLKVKGSVPYANKSPAKLFKGFR